MRLVVIVALFFSHAAFAQYDTLHYLPPVFVSDAIKSSNSNCRDHFLLLSTLESSSFQVTITRGDGAVFSDYTVQSGSQVSTGVFNLSRSAPVKLQFNSTGFNVENIISRASLNMVLDTIGYTLTAQKPFFANLRHRAGAQAASLTCKGTTALGTNFYAGFQAVNNSTSASLDDEFSHFIAIMATINNTNVTVDGFNTGVTFFGQPSSGSPLTAQPITVTLNAGESYVIAQTRDLMSVSMNEYNGTHISADKNIVVNTGTWTGPSNGSSRDIGIDQLVPVSFAGQKYAIVKGKNNSSTNGLEKVILISTQSGTTNVTFGAGSSVTLSGLGDYAVISGNSYWISAPSVAAGTDAHRNMAITSDQPIQLFQTLFGGSSNATSSMNMIPPLADCIGSDSIYIPDVEQFGNNTVISISSPVTSSIRIEDEDGDLLLNIAPSTENLPGTIITDFVTSLYSIPDTVTDVLVTGDEKFTLGFLGASSNVGGAGYLSAFSDRAVEYSDSDPLFVGNGRARLDLCEENPSYITIEDPTIYDGFQWFKDDILIPGETDDSLAVSAVGEYNAIATYCSLPLESTAVIVDEFGSPGEQGFSKISALFESETFDGFLNASNIVDWDEQSKDFNNASIVGNGPTVSNTDYNKPGFHPVARFEATNSEYLKTINPISNLNGSNRYSFFVVLKDSNTTSGHAVLSLENSSSGPKILKTPTGYRFAQDLLTTGGPITADVATNTDEYLILSCVSNGTTVELSANGKQGPINFGNTTANTLDIGSQLIIGSDEEGENRYFNGFIAEFILFDTSLTASERQIVETYYGVKYGITLDPTNDEVGINDGDYVSNNLSVVWDYSANSVYHNSVAGIGLDECGRLRQWQNRDANNQDVISIGIGTIAHTVGANPNSFGSDNTYFMWGRNTDAFDSDGETDFGTTTNGEVMEARVARVWKSQETGTVGSLRIQFDLSGGTNSSIFDLADVRLLVDTDDVFATGALSISPSSYSNATGIVNFDHDFVSGSGFFFTLGSINATTTPLPISLTSFTAEEFEETKVVCRWKTSSEVNNAYFTIEKSLDGEHWVFLADVTGAGNSAMGQSYSLIDPNPFYGRSYYRLSQTDFDGMKTYAGVESVNIKNLSKPSINIYPNPAQTVITVLSNQAINGEIQIFNGRGQLVLSKTILESHKTEVNISSLSAGVYYVKTYYGNLKEITKLVVN